MTTWFTRQVLYAASFLVASFMMANAQPSAQPLVEVELSETDVIPGQPTVLRITVLVPTWLPKPVAFPTFEVPDLMVKLPERATSPVSRTIEGETWSGVSRGYRISPMVPGTIRIPSQQLTITWADPGQPEPLVTQTMIEPMQVTGIVPEGAEDLDPFIAATGLKLTEDISTDTRDLKPGDSLVRKIVLEIDGTSPLFVPKLLPPHEIEGIASYPAEPEVIEMTDRTWLSGTRVESITLVAQSGGSGRVPPVALDWFNLETNTVETARIDGFELRVDGPVARNRPDVDLRLVVVFVLGFAALLVGCIRIGLRLRPKVVRWINDRRDARQSTELWAYNQVCAALQERDYGTFMTAFGIWKARIPGNAVMQDPALQVALSNVGRSMFGSTHTDGASVWSDLSDALKNARDMYLAEKKHNGQAHDLSPINPV